MLLHDETCPGTLKSPGSILTQVGFAILFSWIVLAVPKEGGFAGIALIILGPLTIVAGSLTNVVPDAEQQRNSPVILR